MRKTFFLYLILIIFVSCSGSDTKVSKREFPKTIVGKWKAVHLGKNFNNMHITLPASFEFNKNGTYIQTFTENDVRRDLLGTYEIKLKKTIVLLNLYQKAPRKMRILGILDFANKDAMRLVLNNPFVRKRPKKFTPSNLQTYVRVKEKKDE